MLENHEAVRVRTDCELVGQVLSLQLSLGLVCRLRSRYLLLAIRDSARALNYNTAVFIVGRALVELRLWAGPLSHLPEEPMYTRMRRADYAHGCDASDHAPGPIVVTAPQGSFMGACFRRRLRDEEAQRGSLLREMMG